jgi:hypothetical protein
LILRKRDNLPVVTQCRAVFADLQFRVRKASTATKHLKGHDRPFGVTIRRPPNRPWQLNADGAAVWSTDSSSVG